MNKQQLASKIWESANKMRSKIEANEYKDYILGFIFYKFLSDKEVSYLKILGYTESDMTTVVEDETEIVVNVQNNIGYFISYENLFSTWLAKGNDFGVADVRDALSAFNRLINSTHRKVFEKIFDTLQTGLSKLGDSAGSQTKAIKDLIHLIQDIPMDGRQDYDVLGFIYEYLISNFAANAGKKAGEFYTPHEVSLLMSEIVAKHLCDRKEIKIYDPTSGSGSLLINIGKSVSKHMGDSDRIKYYAQELKENTYNLTRMNLVMRGIIPSNIMARNGDTLEDDWPYFDENDPVGTYDPLYVDAVVSNPPYSQKWNTADKEGDPRYSAYGIAPKGKADYAFLLHDLYHVKPDGIMTIVLPHGVLFRGGVEGTIREKLIENNKIDAIIGLPANIFFGTGIPTIIMVLKQRRSNTDVLIIDASKGYEKVGKNNKLRSADIKRIVDVISERKTVEKFSKVVSRDEIRNNDFNLNIPRYVDSSEKAESWDIYASMFGGVPASEVEELSPYWKAFPNLKNVIFTDCESEYLHFVPGDLRETIRSHPDTIGFENDFRSSFDSFGTYLYSRLIENVDEVNISNEETVLSSDIFRRLQNIPLVDPYCAYQILDDNWVHISNDLEIIQTEGFDAVRNVDPRMVIKKRGDVESEVQDGWVGRVLPFDLVQEKLLATELNEIKIIEARLAEISSEYEELIDKLAEDDKQNILNDDNTEFIAKEICNVYKSILSEIETDEICILSEYMNIKEKNDKLDFISSRPQIKWEELEQAKDGTYSKSTVNKYIDNLRKQVEFPQDSFEYVISKASELIEEEKEQKKEMKERSAALVQITRNTIEELTDENARCLLNEKWIATMVRNILAMPTTIIGEFISKLEMLAKKYETTFEEVETEIEETENKLCSMITQLTGSEFDMKGLAELQKLFGGE